MRGTVHLGWPKLPASAAAIVVVLLMPDAAPALDPDPLVAGALAEITADTLLARVNDLVAIGTRRWDSPGGKVAQEYVRSALAELPLDEVDVQSFDTGSDNVIGILRGSRNPERIHVIGAHYDSITYSGSKDSAPGADDNASGTAAVLEAARTIAWLGIRPAETIYFIAFSGEEPGLVGSQYFVKDAASRGETFADMINLDMIGYLEPGTRVDLSVASPSTTPAVLALLARLGDVAAAYLPDVPYESGTTCMWCSDHSYFLDRGIPAVFIAEDHEFFSPYLHTQDDVVGTSLNSPEEFQANARLAAAAIAVLAGLSDPTPSTRFIRGDANADGKVDVSDAVKDLFHLFLAESIPCEKAADATDDGRLDISDPILILDFLFGGHAAPREPSGSCGLDPTGDDRSCESFPACP
jgi:hypothetical protein